MQNIFAIWLSLLACLAIIGVAGVKLSRHGDIIAWAQSNNGDFDPADRHQRIGLSGQQATLLKAMEN